MTAKCCFGLLKEEEKKKKMKQIKILTKITKTKNQKNNPYGNLVHNSPPFS